MTRTVSWRGCAGCNGTLLLDELQQNEAAALDAAGAYLLCADCRKRLDAEEARLPVKAGARCVLSRYQSGPFSDLFIKEVAGDQITVGVLGMTGTANERLREILSRWWPAGTWDRASLTFARSELRMKSW